RAQLRKSKHRDAEDPDEYLRENIFWVPRDARWSRLRDAAKQPEIGKLIDDAMRAIERDNQSLKNVLPKNSVVVSTRAPVGYLAIARSPLTANQGFRSSVVKEGFDPVFVYYLLSNNVEHPKFHASGAIFGELRGTTT
ncbi:MAG: type I restriction-modification system subunit M N-terminal domain-containing protein, partial [Gammaproteobacteria bacterium]|nr:type I restriction-modification system subunit M N-terminal domain-containing protein [Gammaproteobacteria bacterium]